MRHISRATMAVVILAVALTLAAPMSANPAQRPMNRLAAALPCDDEDAGWCVRPGEEVGINLWGYTAGGECTIRYEIDWGDGTPPEERIGPTGSSDYASHSYQSVGVHTLTATTTVLSGHWSCYTVDWERHRDTWK